MKSFFITSLAKSLALHILGVIVVAVLLGRGPGGEAVRSGRMIIDGVSLVGGGGRGDIGDSNGNRSSIEGGIRDGNEAGPSGGNADGNGGDKGAAAVAVYLGTVRARILSEVRYPESLKNNRVSGTVQVSVTLNANGTVTESSVTESSGSAELDRLALRAVQRAAPFAAFSEELRHLGQLSFRLPIDFKLL